MSESGKLAPVEHLIRGWREAGDSLSAISDKLLLDYGIDASKVGIYHCCKRNGWMRGQSVPGQRKLSPPQQARLRRQKAQGMTYRQLMAYWGISGPTVWKYLRRYGVSDGAA